MKSALFRSKRTAILTLSLLVLSAAGTATAGLLGISGDSVLYDLNTTNGAPSNSRNVGNKVTAIAYAPWGTLYGVSHGFPTDVPIGGQLFTIVESTGFPTLVATMDTFIATEGDIAFDPTSGTLYAVDGEGQLFTINTTNGQGAVIGDISSSNIDISAIAFDAAGNLFAVDSFGPSLLKVNKANAAVISTKPLSPVNQEVGGLAFRPSNGILFHASGYSSSKLDTVDPNTGNATAVGPIPVNGGIWGLTFAPEEPTGMRSMSWGRVKASRR